MDLVPAVSFLRQRATWLPFPPFGLSIVAALNCHTGYVCCALFCTPLLSTTLYPGPGWHDRLENNNEDDEDEDETQLPAQVEDNENDFVFVPPKPSATTAREAACVGAGKKRKATASKAAGAGAGKLVRTASPTQRTLTQMPSSKRAGGGKAQSQKRAK